MSGIRSCIPSSPSKDLIIDQHTSTNTDTAAVFPGPTVLSLQLRADFVETGIYRRWLLAPLTWEVLLKCTLGSKLNSPLRWTFPFSYSSGIRFEIKPRFYQRNQNFTRCCLCNLTGVVSPQTYSRAQTGTSVCWLLLSADGSQRPNSGLHKLTWSTSSIKI